MIRSRCVLVAMLLTMSGYTAAVELADTTWQLLSIQSMDDAQGTLQVNEPGHFTLEFGRDGRAALRLDCNRASAEYTTAPAADGSSGALTFGPIAGTCGLCPSSHLDQRVVRDLAQVRAYLLKHGKLYLSLLADGGLYEWAPQPTAPAAADKEQVIEPVQFAKGTSSAVINSRIVGRHYIDYTLRVGAGQRMTVSLTGSNSANYFNLLPPGSTDAAMATGELSENRFDGLLPDDGVYTIRVFLYRAAARNNEASDFTLSVGVIGAPLKPLSSSQDAVLLGTRYHAATNVPCAPAYSQTRDCEARVIRRGVDGTATVELCWDDQRKRRILFIKGADTAQAMTFTRNERGWRVSFGENEHFEIPEPLVFGG